MMFCMPHAVVLEARRCGGNFNMLRNMSVVCVAGQTCNNTAILNAIFSWYPIVDVRYKQSMTHLQRSRCLQPLVLKTQFVMRMTITYKAANFTCVCTHVFSPCRIRQPKVRSPVPGNSVASHAVSLSLRGVPSMEAPGSKKALTVVDGCSCEYDELQTNAR
jgi:hypothetical protein